MDKIKRLIRSVLMSSKEGVLAHCFEKEFQDLTMTELNPREFGFNNINDFMTSMQDVVRVMQTRGEVIFHAVATAETQHIKRLVSNQKSNTKKTKKVTVKCRAINQRYERALYQRSHNSHQSTSGCKRNVAYAGKRQSVNKPIQSPNEQNAGDQNKIKTIKTPSRRNPVNMNRPKAIKCTSRQNAGNLNKSKNTTGITSKATGNAKSTNTDGLRELSPVILKTNIAHDNQPNFAIPGKVESTDTNGWRDLSPVIVKNKIVYVNQPNSFFDQGAMGKLIVVMVTRVSWPDLFMVPVERLGHLETITTMIVQYFSKDNASRYCNPSAGDKGIYAAICNSHTEPVWRRVEIGDVFGKHTSVYLVDSGEVDVVPTGSLRYIPQPITSIPKLAIVGRLGGIAIKDTLSLNARYCFEKILTGHRLTAHVMDSFFEENMPIYDICVYRDNGKGVECINDEMVVEWKVADYLKY